MDIGIQEVLVISVIALVVLGPERLPVAIKTIALWINRLRRSFNDVRQAIEQEIGAEDIRRQIHNENILHELGETKQTLTELEQQLQQNLTQQDESNKDSTALPKPVDKHPSDTVT